MNHLNIIFDKAMSSAAVPNDASLIWAASAIDFMVQWYMGRSIWRLVITREAWTADSSRFKVWPIDKEDRPLRCASVTRIGDLIARKEFPVRLIDKWSEHSMGNEGTLVNFSGIAPQVTIGLLTYGLADMAMDCFKRGAKLVRCQYSCDLSQIFADVGLNERELREFTDLNEPDYEAHERVGDLP